MRGFKDITAESAKDTNEDLKIAAALAVHP
jgi:hypothetical protein